MADWYPKPNFASDGSAASLGSEVAAVAKNPPEVPMPEVGDTIRLVVEPWGHVFVLSPNHSVPQNSTVIECEVKGLKTAKIVLE